MKRVFDVCCIIIGFRCASSKGGREVETAIRVDKTTAVESSPTDGAMHGDIRKDENIINLDL